MNKFDNFRFKVVWALGYVPILNRMVFRSADAIYSKLEARGFIKYIRDLRASERRLLHFSLGMGIRNEFLLWHPKNPYTSLALAGLSAENAAVSPFHPDQYSWGIIRRMIVAATDTDPSRVFFKAEEALVHSILSSVEDDDATHVQLADALAALVVAKRYDIINEIIEETLFLKPSQDKVNIVLWSARGHRDHLDIIAFAKLVALLQKDAVNN